MKLKYTSCYTRYLRHKGVNSDTSNISANLIKHKLHIYCKYVHKVTKINTLTFRISTQNTHSAQFSLHGLYVTGERLHTGGGLRHSNHFYTFLTGLRPQQQYQSQVAQDNLIYTSQHTTLFLSLGLTAYRVYSPSNRPQLTIP